MNALEELKSSIITYDAHQASESAQQAMTQGVDPIVALDAITEVLTDIGNRFGSGELFLPDLVGAADAAQAALPIIEKQMTITGQEAKTPGTIVIGTVQGDIHDIGKSMVAALLIAHGFKVVDVGTDVPTEKFIEAIKRQDVDILALSALLTTTATQQKRVIAAVEDAGLRNKVKIIVGGGAINADYARSIGADGYGDSAAEGVELVRELLKVEAVD